MSVRVLIALSLLACVPLTIAPNDAVGFTTAEVNKLIACESSIEAETKTLTRTTLDVTRACLDAKLPPVLKHENGLIDDPTFTQLDAAAETLCLNQFDTLGPASTRFVNRVTLACSPVGTILVTPGTPPTGDPLQFHALLNATNIDQVIGRLCLLSLEAGLIAAGGANPRGFTIIQNDGTLNAAMIVVDPRCAF